MADNEHRHNTCTKCRRTFRLNGCISTRLLNSYNGWVCGYPGCAKVSTRKTNKDTEQYDQSELKSREK